MNAPWHDVCCGFCVAKTVVPCDMATQSKTEAIVEKTWKLVATKYPQPGSPNRLKWDKYFAFFNDHFQGIQEPSPPEGLKPFASLWIIYKTGVLRSTAFSPVLRRAPASRVQLSLAPSIPLSPTPAAGGQHQHHPPVQHHRQTRRGQWAQVGTSPRATGTAAGGQQHQQQQQDQRQVTEEEQQQPGGEGAGPSSSKRPRPAEDQALIQSLIHKVDNVQETVNRLEGFSNVVHCFTNLVQGFTDSSCGSGMVYQLPTLLLYTGEVYQPHELEQCRQAALANGLTIFQLPQLAIDMAAVVAASILITRVYNHMVFSSVSANSKTQYGTGQRVQVVLAKSDKNSSGDLDTTLQLLSDDYNTAVYSALTEEKKKEVDEAKEVLAQYLTLLQPVLRQLLGRPLNALATIITDPTWQRRLNRNGNMVTTLAQQLAQAQAPHTDFLPVGPGMDDGLVFLLALQDFPLVAYMGSHKLSRLAAAHCWRSADGQKQVVEVKDMDALTLTLPLQLGTEVLVKAGQLVLFRGNTVHAGNVGVAGSCCARLYGFGRPDTVADNTTMNTSELGDLYHGLFQPIQDEGINPKMADWNRRGMAGQWDPVGEQQDPVVRDQDPVVPGPCGEGPGPCGARTLWTLWCQDPVVRGQDPVGAQQDPVDPVSQDPMVRCLDPVVRCQNPVVPGPCGEVTGPCGPGPCRTLWCQNPVVMCQDPVGQNPVVRGQDPVGVQQDPVVRYQDPVVPEPCGVVSGPCEPEPCAANRRLLLMGGDFNCILTPVDRVGIPQGSLHGDAWVGSRGQGAEQLRQLVGGRGLGDPGRHLHPSKRDLTHFSERQTGARLEGWYISKELVQWQMDNAIQGVLPVPTNHRPVSVAVCPPDLPLTVPAPWQLHPAHLENPDLQDCLKDFLQAETQHHEVASQLGLPRDGHRARWARLKQGLAMRAQHFLWAQCRAQRDLQQREKAAGVARAHLVRQLVRVQQEGEAEVQAAQHLGEAAAQAGVGARERGAQRSLLASAVLDQYYGDRSSFYFYHRDQPVHTPTLISSLLLPGQPGQPADLTTVAGVKAACRAFQQHYSAAEPTGVYATKPVDTAARATLLGSLTSHLTPTQTRAAEGPDGSPMLSKEELGRALKG
ncbi:hypothetical protein QJQ45_008959 [Haematococcus lacustris]|nr:hypothetical protein QJQ45_008959 [Haematococcus lacustris]